MKANEKAVLGPVMLKNRIILAPLKTALNLPGGRVTPEAKRFYRRIARGGSALLTLEPAAVAPGGVEHPKQLRIHKDENIAELAKLVDAIHEEGALAMIHLNHSGRAANPKVIGGLPVAPSAMMCPATGAEAVELTAKQIEEILDGYGESAGRAASAGADLIEVQLGHGYLASQFLSPRTNLREDEWGRDAAGRLRFSKEVVERVTATAGPVPVIARISGKEFVPRGIEPFDLKELLDILEVQRVAAVHVGFGNVCESPAWYFNHMSLPQESQDQVFRAIRSMTSLPIIAVGRLGNPERLSKVLDEGMADFIALGRPLLADPDFPKKLFAGEENRIFYCGACLQACLSHVKSSEPISCAVNPWTTRPAPAPRQVERR